MDRVLAKLNPDVARLRPYQGGRPIAEVARELGLAPDSIIKIASNENPLGPSPKALAALREALEELHRYPDGNSYELRQGLARHLDLAPEQILPGNGSNEILELVGHCFLNRERSVVYSAHAFVVYKLVGTLFGARQLEVPMTAGLEHDLEAMLAAIQPDTAVVFVCNPNNPTGTIASPEALARFLEAVPEDVLVVIDEAYHELCLGPQLDSLQYVREGRNVLVTRTFSKAYGLAGLRLGYGCAHPALVTALNQARQPFNSNLAAQVAGLAALADDGFVAETRALCAAGRDYLVAECDKLGLPCVPTFANFMLVEVGDAAAVTQRLIEQGVIVRPMAGYELPRHLRVTFGTQLENERLVAALGTVCRP